MGEQTKIEWCDHTFNAWVGCTKVSPACDHCYAEGWAKRTGQSCLWQGQRRRTTPANWRQPLKWNAEAERLGIRYRVFCASLADVFDNQVDTEWRADLWALIAKTPNLDWLLLTKRPQNIKKMLPDAMGLGVCAKMPWPWSHVWLGTTAENQEEADRRVPHLLQVPAAVRFLSCEPLLGAIDLEHLPSISGIGRYLDGLGTIRDEHADAKGPVDWVICGGESGPHARPMHPDWARSLRDQCAEAGVAFHHKQNGEFAPGEIAGDYLDPEKPARGMSWTGTLDGWHEAWSEPDGHIDDEPDVYRIGKKRAGRKLDGIEHNAFPSLQHSEVPNG